MEPTYILRALGGSHAHGLATPESDQDWVGVYSWPTTAFWSLQKPAQSLVRHDPVDEAYHELEKFLALAAKSNPTVLEVLWLDEYNRMEPFWGEELLAIRSAFASEHYVLKAFVGYAESQFRKMMTRAREYEGVPRLQGETAELLLRDAERRAGRTGAGLQALRRHEAAQVSRKPQGEAHSGGRGDLPASQEGQVGPEEVGHPTCNLRVHGAPSGQQVQDLQGAYGRPGPLSPDGGVARDALPEVQPGNGALPRRSGTTAGGSELPAGPLRPRERKAAIHAFRLLEQGRALYTTGIMPAKVADREQYFEWGAWNTDRLSEEFHRQWYDFLGATSVLPEEPDYAVINDYLHRYRRGH